DPELAHGFEFSRQAVGVPSEAAVHLLAAHRLESREQVLRVAGQQVTVVRESVGEWWAIVEDPLLASFPLVDGRSERLVPLPERENAGLELGEAGARTQLPGRGIFRLCWLVRCGTRVGHVSPGRPRVGSFICTRTVDDLL